VCLAHYILYSSLSMLMLCRTALHKLKASSSSSNATAAAGDGDSSTSRTYLPVLPHSYKRTFDHDHLMKRRKRLIQFLEVCTA
jgi:hypothetical protein